MELVVWIWGHRFLDCRSVACGDVELEGEVLSIFWYYPFGCYRLVFHEASSAPKPLDQRRQQRMGYLGRVGLQ